MTLASWIAFALLWWCMGYATTRWLGVGNLANVPMILFALCGWPRNKSLPNRVVSVLGLSAQLAAYILVLFRVGVESITNFRGLIDSLSIITCYLIGSGIAFLLFKQNPYEPG